MTRARPKIDRIACPWLIRRFVDPRAAFLSLVEMVKPGFWAQWDAERLRRNGGTLEQYKHPCLIGDLEFQKRAKVEP